MVIIMRTAAGTLLILCAFLSCALLCAAVRPQASLHGMSGPSAHTRAHAAYAQADLQGLHGTMSLWLLG